MNTKRIKSAISEMTLHKKIKNQKILEFKKECVQK